MKKLRIAIVGCKNMGRKHLECLRECFADRVKISGILNSSEESTKKASAELGVNAFESISKINKRNTDAVIVATPAEHHFEVAKFLLQKKIPLLVEKPFAETDEQCFELQKTAQENEVLLMVGHTENYNPAVVLLKKELSEQIKSLAAIRTSNNPGFKKTHVISELMIHDLAIVNSLIKGQWIEASLEKDEKYRWDEHAIVEMKYDSGSIVRLESIRADVERERRMRIIDMKNNIWQIDFLERRLSKNGEVLTEGGNSLKNELEDFLNMLETGQNPQVGAEEARAIVRLCKELEDIKN